MERKIDLESAKATYESAEGIYSENDGKLGPGMTGQCLDALGWAIKEIERLNKTAQDEINEQEHNRSW